MAVKILYDFVVFLLSWRLKLINYQGNYSVEKLRLLYLFKVNKFLPHSKSANIPNNIDFFLV